MKNNTRIMSLLMIATVLLSGCSNPVKDYKEVVIDLQIQENITKINDGINNLIELYNAFNEAELKETYETEEEMLNALGYEELLDQLTEISILVAETNSLAESIEMTDDEVITTHQNLVKAMAEYRAVIDVTNKNVDFLSKIIAEGVFFNQYYSELFALILSEDQPSVLVSFQLFSLLDEYDQEMSFFTSEDESYMALIQDGTIDVKKLEDYNSACLEAKEKVLAIEATNENDERYIEIVSELLGHAVNITTILVNDAQLIEEMHQEESYESYVKNKQVIIDEYISNWQEAMEL